MTTVPKPRKRPITPGWIAQVRAWLDETGPEAQKLLAARVGCKSPNITYILQGEQEYSKYVEAISRVTGATLPPEEPLDAHEQALLDKWRALSARERRIAIEQLDALMRNRIPG